jgi:pimeloyl-ACP methyl ester carboxylesterase
VPKHRTLLLFALLLGCPSSVVHCSEPVRRTEEAVYGRKAGMVLPMDVFQPARPNGVEMGPLAALQVAFGALALTSEGREQLGREISSINYVTDQMPPTLIIHGTRDDVVPPQQSESFAAKGRQAGAAHADLILRVGKGHGWDDFWKSSEDITAFADWFDRHLNPRD